MFGKNWKKSLRQKVWSSWKKPWINKKYKIYKNRSHICFPLLLLSFLTLSPKNMNPGHRETSTGMLGAYGSSYELLLLLAYLRVLGGVLSDEQLPRHAPHQGHHTLAVEESTPAHDSHHPLRHWSTQCCTHSQTWNVTQCCNVTRHTEREREREYDRLRPRTISFPPQWINGLTNWEKMSKGE